MKIAILILIHEFKEQQKILITHLSKTFDIYVHIDKKSKISIDDVKTPNVYPYKKYKVYWGSYNQIRATLFLYSKANEKKYDRYIFISGSDIPIKSNQQIINFFTNNEKEYFSFTKLPTPWWNGNGGFERIDYFHTNEINRCKVSLFEKIATKITKKINEKLVTPIMKKIHIIRRIKKLDYYGGANWMDLTGNCVSQIIDYINSNPNYLRKFKYTRCADEIFFQTIICNFTENLQLENNCLRYVDWETGPEFPRILRMEDYEKLVSTNSLFARKFSYKIDENIINELYQFIKQ